MSTQTADDLLNSILNGTVDDLSDVPSFEPFPIGTHRALLSLELKKVGNNHAVEAKFVAMESVELANPEDKPLVAGDSTNMLYFLTHQNAKTMELGQGQFKEMYVIPLNAQFGDRPNIQVINDTKGVEVLITTGRREGKEGKIYTDLKALVIC